MVKRIGALTIIANAMDAHNGHEESSLICSPAEL